MTREMVETIRKLAESHNFGGVPIPQLCDLAAKSFDLQAALREALLAWECFAEALKDNPNWKEAMPRINTLRAEFLDDK